MWSTSLVRGDVVLLETGDIVPADVRLCKADDLKVNEMLLTGEPEDVNKFDRIKRNSKYRKHELSNPTHINFYLPIYTLPLLKQKQKHSVS